MPEIPRMISVIVDDSSDHGSSSSHGRRVHFGTISIRRYDVRPGDNPSCTHGIPLSLDWTYVENDPVDLRLFHCMQHMSSTALLQTSSPPKSKMKRYEEMRLSETERWKRLRQFGFSSDDLKKANPNQKICDIRQRVMQERENRLKSLVLAQQQEALQPKTLPDIPESAVRRNWEKKKPDLEANNGSPIKWRKLLPAPGMPRAVAISNVMLLPCSKARQPALHQGLARNGVGVTGEVKKNLLYSVAQTSFVTA